MTQEERTEFEERRRGMIGGSDCGSIMQVEGCRNIMDVWRSKVDPDFKKPHLAVYDAGNELEWNVIKKFQDKTGFIVTDKQRLVNYEEFPVILNSIGCHIDGFANSRIKDSENIWREGVVEAKTAAFKTDQWGKEGTDEVPMDILFQSHHNMMCCNTDKCYIPVLFRAEWLFEIFIVHRDKDLEKHIIETEVKFWNNHVLTKTPPIVEETRIAIPESARVATPDIVDDVCEYRSVSSQLKNLEAKKKVLRAKINQFIGAYEKVTFDGKTLATYKSFERTNFDKEKFHVENPELAEKYTRKYMMSQLRVK